LSNHLALSKKITENMNDLIYTPTKRYRAWNDPFFIEGNVAATAAGEAFTESTISYDTLDELLSR
jgi:hypothetical protein